MANGVVYVTTGTRLLAYDEAAVRSCAGAAPNRECQPVMTRTYANGVSGSQPVIWDGTVYVSTFAALHALRLPA
jgi:hypothetical protein